VRDFSYERPKTLDEAVALLETPGVNAASLAGGTDLLIRLREDRPLVPSVIVDLKRVSELRSGIQEADDRIRIGAETVMTDIVGDKRVRRHFPALAEAAALVGSLQIRNRATLAGNICNASPAADTAPPLLAYGAVVVTYGPLGQRSLPIDEFFVGPRQTSLQRGELVTAIELPVPRHPSGSAFGRLTRRRGTDLATISVSVLLDGTGSARLSCGAVGPRPFVTTDDSGMLADPAASAAARNRVLARLTEPARPISDVRASASYRAAMLLVLSRRVTQIALARRQEG
jgi:CO/xanthine dehydrogenase FAD-binding subunit